MVERFGRYVWVIMALVAVSVAATVLTPDIAGELVPWASLGVVLGACEACDYHRQWRFARELESTDAYVRDVRVVPEVSGAHARLRMSDGSWLEFRAVGTQSRIERRPGIGRVTATGDGWVFTLSVPAGLVHDCARHLA